MTNVCMYFQVHQPFRLKKFSAFDIGTKADYFDEKKNKEIARKVADKCYLPATKILLEICAKHPDFKIAFSLSGCAIEQFKEYCPDVLANFQKLAATGNVEFLNETYFHSLSALFDKEEFCEQVNLHKRAIKELFGKEPTVFRNTELIYSNEIAELCTQLGFRAVLAEGADHVLSWRSPNFVYHAPSGLPILLKNYRLSDDIAFRFSNKSWEGWPMNAEKYASWLSSIEGHSINLFMDFETFGEHQWAETGIFSFLEALPKEFASKGIETLWPSEVATNAAVGLLDIQTPMSWADIERDVSAWLGNSMQRGAAEELYKLKAQIVATGNNALLNSWRKLTTSDHFYYMCTKWFSDGDVHKYFNPYDSPYECFIAFMNVLQDIKLQTEQKEEQQWLKVN